MSRIGRKPIPVPAGVKIAVQAGKIDVQGPKGKLTFAIPHGITFEQKDGILTALRATEEHRALHGSSRPPKVDPPAQYPSSSVVSSHALPLPV